MNVIAHRHFQDGKDDPTGTHDIIAKISRELLKRWRAAEAIVTGSIEKNDLLTHPGVGSYGLMAFQKFLDETLRHSVVEDGSWMGPYIADAIARAEKRARKILVQDFNPNHDERGRFAEAQQATEAFKTWFGKSKVVDENGKPLVVYHGTVRDFEAFSAAHVGANYEFSRGLYFSASPEVASNYAMWHSGSSFSLQGGWRQGEEPSRVMPVYLSIKNPLVKTARGTLSPVQAADRNIEKWKEEATHGNHDGLIVVPGLSSHRGSNEAFGRAKLYIAFEPTQVKSAIGNKGTFDPSSPKIIDAYNPDEPRDDKGRWTAEEFRAFIASNHQKMVEFQQEIEAAIEKHGAYAAKTDDGRTIIVTPSLSEPGLYQISNLDKDGEATGHTNSRKGDVARDVRGYGVQPGTPQITDFNPYHDERGRFAEAQQSSQAFKDWFGNSKAVDENGKPLVLYHITPADFDVFKPGGEKIYLSGPAIWLTPETENQPAAHNTGGRAGVYKEGTNVMPLYARIEHPLVVTKANEKEMRKQYSTPDSAFPLRMNATEVYLMKEEGFDGVIVKGWKSKGEDKKKSPDEYIVFDPEQVKSALSNRGTFSRASPKITDFDPDQPRDERGRWSEAVQGALTPDLLKPEYREENACNPMFGHCYAASEAVYHLIGGQKSGYVPHHGKDERGITHWWLQNKKGDIIDPTSAQYTSVGKVPPYAAGVGGGYLTREPSKRAAEIMRRVQSKLADAGPVDEPRDERGRWSEGGGESAAIAKSFGLPHRPLDPSQPVYLRFGDWNTKFETSHNYAAGEMERGVSVYELKNGQPVAPPEGEWAEEDLQDRLSGKVGNDPAFLVQGTHVGTGHDGEPLLLDVGVVGMWRPYVRDAGFNPNQPRGEHGMWTAEGNPYVYSEFKEPTKTAKTIRAFKLFRTLPSRPGEIFPTQTDIKHSIPFGKWLPAEYHPRPGVLAPRPGWHAGILPTAPQMRSTKTGNKQSHLVWAEVEMEADKHEAIQAAANAQPSRMLGTMIPKGGYYFFHPNSKNYESGWVVSGAMKVIRLLPDKEVRELLMKAGRPEDAKRETAHDAGPPDEPRDKEGRWTASFETWFKGSKVVDDGGKPLVVYHATEASFDTFNTKNSEMGAHFGTKQQASSFKGEAQGYYLSIQNPYRMTDFGQWDPATVAGQMEVDDIAKPGFQDDVLEMTSDEAIKTVQSHLQAAGHDGIVYLNRREGVDIDEEDQGTFELEATDEEFHEKYPKAQESYIAFEPTQIKSATKKLTDADPVDWQSLLTATATAELQGVLDATSQQAARVVSAGLLAHQRPAKISRDVVSVLKNIGQRRSAMVADYIVIKAFAAATLETFRAQGVTHVGTIPEMQPRALRDFDPDEPRDERGRWITSGEGHDLVTLYHGTSHEHAEAIRKTGVIQPQFRPEDKGKVVYLTSSHNLATVFAGGNEKNVFEVMVPRKEAEDVSHRREKFTAAVVRKPIKLRDAGFDPAQPRDKYGKWAGAAFKEWFRGSKAVDSRGRPLTLHHGTYADFSEFREGKPIWFSANADLAARYGKMQRDFLGGVGDVKVHDVFLRATNPLVLPFDMNDRLSYGQLREKTGLPFNPGEEVYEDDKNTVIHRFKANELINDPKFTALAKQAGYDSIQVNEGGVKTFAVFDPAQIKSAMENKGAFDPRKRSIYDAARKTPQKRHAKTGRFTKYAEEPSGYLQRKARRAYKQLQELPEVDVQTAEDDRVCQKCEDISASGPYEIDTALSLIPAHINCRCIFVPAGTLDMGDAELYGDAGPVDEPRDRAGKWTDAWNLPPAPGTAPIPPGTVRLYHQTTEDKLGAIRHQGILLSKAQGIEGPKAVYADERGFYGSPSERPTVEFWVDKWDPPFIVGDVPPSQIVAVHRPWHAHARYIENNPDSLKQVLAGEHDDLLSDRRYGTAIRFIKHKYAVRDAGFDPNEPREEHGRWIEGGSSKNTEVKNCWIKSRGGSLSMVGSGGVEEADISEVPRDVVAASDLNDAEREAIALKTTQAFRTSYRFPQDVDVSYLMKGNQMIIDATAAGTNEKVAMIRAIDFEHKSADHEFLQLDNDTQSAGIGKAILRDQIATYERMGINTVTLKANISVGGYAWAKYGFVPEPKYFDHLVRHWAFEGKLESFGISDPPAYGQWNGEAFAKDPKNIWKIADSPVGKHILLGSEWPGKLDLKDEEAMKRFHTYVSKHG